MSFCMKIGRPLQGEILDLSNEGNVTKALLAPNCLNITGVDVLVSYAKIDSKSNPISNLFIRLANEIWGIKTVRVKLGDVVTDVRVWESDYIVLKGKFDQTVPKIQNIYAKVKSSKTIQSEPKTIQSEPKRPQVKLGDSWSVWTQREGAIWFSEAPHLGVILSDGKNYYHIEEKDLQGRAGEALSSVKCKKTVIEGALEGKYENFREGQSGHLSILGDEIKFIPVDVVSISADTPLEPQNRMKAKKEEGPDVVIAKQIESLKIFSLQGLQTQENILEFKRQAQKIKEAFLSQCSTVESLQSTFQNPKISGGALCLLTSVCMEDLKKKGTHLEAILGCLQKIESQGSAEPYERFLGLVEKVLKTCSPEEIKTDTCNKIVKIMDA